jgi:patatin-like phospholipase/acyl hydrolase
MKDIEKTGNILCLDGGGSKGVYTLGVLSELEKAVSMPLCDFFGLIYGTSTGSIIASMLALGWEIKDIKSKYFTLVPEIMGKRTKTGKSQKLSELGKKIFKEQKFDAFKTGVGIVALNYETQKPLIFKNDIARAHGTISSFVPGFGVTILDAVEASCAACPIFDKKVLKTVNKEKLTAIDGGFIANNPTLFALIDAKKALKLNDDQIKLLSIGVGNYIEKPISRKLSLVNKFEMAQIASRVMVASSNTIEVAAGLLFPELEMIRINDTFSKPEHGTNMIERNPDKLTSMFQLGLASYATHEKQIKSIFKI